MKMSSYLERSSQKIVMTSVVFFSLQDQNYWVNFYVLVYTTMKSYTNNSTKYRCVRLTHFENKQ